MPGPLPELFRQFANHEFFVSHAKFPDGSGQLLNLAAKIFLFETLGGFESTKKSNLDKLTAAASKADEDLYRNAAKRIFQVLDEMAEIFTFADHLLGSEGPIPVYYWLVRNSELDNRWLIRDFLADFTNWLISSKLGMVTDSELVSDIANYESALRSVNDKSSHENRYAILAKWFEKWNAGWRPSMA
jgi:hypothetical protein